MPLFGLGNGVHCISDSYSAEYCDSFHGLPYEIIGHEGRLWELCLNDMTLVITTPYVHMFIFEIKFDMCLNELKISPIQLQICRNTMHSSYNCSLPVETIQSDKQDPESGEVDIGRELSDIMQL